MRPGRPHCSRRPLQQPNAEPLLELPHGLSSGGARNSKVVGRLCEAAAIDDPSEQPHCIEPVHASLDCSENWNSAAVVSLIISRASNDIYPSGSR